MHDFIKSTQPGIEAAEAKVKFWALCESLVYQRGEIIDLDLYDETRTLIRLGSLARRYRKENTVGYSWADLNVALLDNYLLLLKPERRSSTETRNVVVSRPIPLEYIQVTSSGLPPEMRKEKSSTAEAQASRSFLESFSIRSSKERHMYPLTISHACDKDKRSYTLYTSCQEEREDWKKAFQSAKFMREVRQDGNKWFAPHTLSEGFFKAHPSGEYARGYTGLTTCAVPFSSSGKSLIAVGCETGVYVTVRGQSSFRKVLLIPHVINIATIPSHNKFLVYCGNGIRSYSLDLLGRVAMQTSPPQPLDASREDVTGSSDYVFFMKVAKFAGKSILLYGTRGMVRVYLNILTPVLPSEIPPQRKKSTNGPLSFKPYVDQPIAVPGDAHDVTALKGKIGICAERGIHIFDLEHLQAVETIIPNLSSSGDQAPMRLLQERITRSKPLGLVRAGVDELLVVYNDVGCYITSTGEPARLCGYLRWETSATSYACRNDNLILFSKNFIEIRAIQTGKLIQVIEGEDIRMVHASEEAVLVAMKQKEDGQHVDGRDVLMELVPTQAIEASPVLQSRELWDEWDM
ncbi:hypothetical protein QCA50_006035 [Cerrena zonata]|uniref:Uncharacterized protein n=1 Tax=Cerrena zonata TaxID=2478898 RepID=A0AAW0GGR9_9APHY